MSCDFLALAQPGVQKLSPYVPGKLVDELARELKLDPAGIVKLASNENPLGPSPKALAAIQAELSELTRYPDGNGFVLKQRLAQRYSVGVHQVTPGNGSNDILELVARAYLAPGLNAVFSEHAFAVYPIATQAVGAEGRAVAAKNWGTISTRWPMPSTRTPGSSLSPTPTTPPDLVRCRCVGYFPRARASPCTGGAGRGLYQYAEGQELPDGLAYLADYPNLLVSRTFQGLWPGGPARRLRHQLAGDRRRVEPRSPALQCEQPGAGRRLRGAG